MIVFVLPNSSNLFSHMCKFEDESSPGYDVVAEAVQR